MIEDNPEMKEMDISPLTAYADGALAEDARAIMEDRAIKGSAE